MKPKAFSHKLRLFYSESCEHCKGVKDFIALFKLPCDMIDGFADDAQDLCDAQDIDDMPHIQIIDAEDKVVANYVWPFNTFEVAQAFYQCDGGLEKAK